MKKILLLGSGELGKEVAIAAQRLGCHVIACDRYPNAPAMQVADESEVFDMTNGYLLKEIVHKTQPEIIIPEIEALEVNTLQAIEKEGFLVIPNAKATANAKPKTTALKSRFSPVLDTNEDEQSEEEVEDEDVKGKGKGEDKIE